MSFADGIRLGMLLLNLTFLLPNLSVKVSKPLSCLLVWSDSSLFLPTTSRPSLPLPPLHLPPPTHRPSALHSLRLLFSLPLHPVSNLLGHLTSPSHPLPEIQRLRSMPHMPSHQNSSFVSLISSIRSWRSSKLYCLHWRCVSSVVVY